jgi:hypothetical protein
MTEKVDNKLVVNIDVPIPGHYLDSLLATKNTLLRSQLEKVRIIAADFKGIELSADEHRALMGIWSTYHRIGYNERTFKNGITLTAYELCKRMGYPADNMGRFGGKARKAALTALLNLSKKTFTIYFTKFKRVEKGENVYDAIVMPNCTLLDIEYEASDITEDELVRGDVEEKVSRIHMRIKPVFYSDNYYKLFRSNFYSRLKEVLSKEGRRVTRYHWIFAFWRLKQLNTRKPLEINIDKLIEILKLPNDPAHKWRARARARELYEDFKRLGDIADYKIDVPTQNGSTKDVIYLRGV